MFYSKTPRWFLHAGHKKCEERYTLEQIHLGFAGFRHGHIYDLYDLAKSKTEQVKICGAWEDFPESIEQAKEKGITITHKTYASMLEDENIHAIAIGNYYGARGEMVIRALEAGKHVISDKPLCTSLNELKTIRHLSESKGLAVGLMLDLRMNKNVVTAMQMIRKGKIGAINNIWFSGQHALLYGTRADWYFEPGKHGGTINDIAIHGIDLVRMFTDSDVAQVLGARCWNFYAKQEPHFLDSGQFMIKLANGAGVVADVSYAAPNSFSGRMPTYWRFEIWGDKGVLIFHADGDGVALYSDGEAEVFVHSPETAPGDCLEEFIKEIRGDTCAALNTTQVLKSTQQTLEIQRYADMSL